MRTITTNIYQFEELSKEAQQNAIENYRNRNLEFSWGYDYLKTIEKGVELFGAKLRNYSIDWGNSFVSYVKISFDNPENENLSGEDLRQYLKDCKGTYSADHYGLTGFCADFDFLSIIEDYINAEIIENNLEYILEECANSVIDAGCNDYEGTQEDESIIENFSANGYEFKENGEII